MVTHLDAALGPRAEGAADLHGAGLHGSNLWRKQSGCASTKAYHRCRRTEEAQRSKGVLYWLQWARFAMYMACSRDLPSRLCCVTQVGLEQDYNTERLGELGFMPLHE